MSFSNCPLTQGHQEPEFSPYFLPITKSPKKAHLCSIPPCLVPVSLLLSSHLSLSGERSQGGGRRRSEQVLPVCRQHPEVPEPRGRAPAASCETGDKTQEVRGPSAGESVGPGGREETFKGGGQGKQMRRPNLWERAEPGWVGVQGLKVGRRKAGERQGVRCLGTKLRC